VRVNAQRGAKEMEGVDGGHLLSVLKEADTRRMSGRETKRRSLKFSNFSLKSSLGGGIPLIMLCISRVYRSVFTNLLP
jgi:hypothetical protein